MKKHEWIKEGDEVDVFAFTSGEYHNGPECSVCGFGFCHHCDPQGYDTECPQNSLDADDSKLDQGLVTLINSSRATLNRN